MRAGGRWRGRLLGALGTAGAVGLLAAAIPAPPAGAAVSGPVFPRRVVSGDLLPSTVSDTQSDWTGAGATVGGGGSAGAVTATAAGNGAAALTLARGTWVAARPGWIYAGTATVRALTGPAGPASVFVLFADANGAALTSVGGQTGQEGTTTSTVLRTIGVAPAGTAYAYLSVVWWTPQAGSDHALTAAATMTGERGGSAPVAGPLHTSGTHILDRYNRVVMLRGVDRNGLMAQVDPLNLTSADIGQAKLWGANMVRVPLGEQLWLSTSCDYDPTYASKVDSVVSWITSRGMVAVLDLHWNFPGTRCGVPGQQVMADKVGALTFWRQVAARYRSNPLVAFDLYNEPHDITWACWRSGCTTSGGWAAAGMQQMYAAVRGTGATNLVFVGGNGYASQPPPSPITGTNVVYAVHAYTCGGSYCVTNSALLDPSGLLGTWRSLGSIRPVMVTEFGWPGGLTGTYEANTIRYAEAHGWGWAVWEWDEGVGGNGCAAAQWWDTVASCTGTYEPSPGGQPVLAGFGRD